MLSCGWMIHQYLCWEDVWLVLNVLLGEEDPQVDDFDSSQAFVQFGHWLGVGEDNGFSGEMGCILELLGFVYCGLEALGDVRSCRDDGNCLVYNLVCSSC